MQRDHSLDVLKGLSCLMMLIAHVPFIRETNSFFEVFNYICHMATMIFFAVSGATMLYQLKGRTLSTIMLTYAMLFLLGYSYNGILNPGYFRNVQVEIIQIIALGSLLVAVIESKLSPANWVYLLIGIGIFSLKMLFDVWAPDFDGAKQIMPRTDYIPWYQRVKNGEPIIFPGFPMLPWLFVFPMGVVAYRQPNALNLIFATAIGGVSLACYWLEIDLDWLEKWDMSPGYFLVACVYIFASFFIFRALSPFIKSTSNPIIFIGRNSLLFLYVHLPFVFLGGLFSFKIQYIWWFNTLWMTYLSMWYLANKTNDATFLKAEKGWIILLSLILLSPALVLVHNAFFIPVYFVELVCGILFARNYKSISGLSIIKATASKRP